MWSIIDVFLIVVEYRHSIIMPAIIADGQQRNIMTERTLLMAPLLKFCQEARKRISTLLLQLSVLAMTVNTYNNTDINILYRGFLNK